MPVVIVQNGLREGELFIRTTFECLSNAAKELNQDLPTIFFIGEAVSLASNNEMLEKTNWKEFG
jgi:siroheme synthase